MKRPTIKTALLTALVLVAVAVCSFAAYAVNRLSMLNHNVAVLATDWLPSIQHSQGMDTALSDLRAAYRDHVLASDGAQEADAMKAIIAQGERFEGELSEYEMNRPGFAGDPNS